MTRAEFATLLARLLKLPAETGQGNFVNVKQDDWFAGYVAAASRAGLIQGDENLFRPNDPITRQEMVLMIMRAASLRNLATGGDLEELGAYADGETVAAWAQNAAAGASELGPAGRGVSGR